MLTSALMLLAATLPPAANASKIAEWQFTPDYSLPIPRERKAEPPPSISPPAWRAPRLADEEASETREDLLQGAAAPSGSFSIELWLLDHVNRPVGTLLVAQHEERPSWTFGYRDGALFFGPVDEPTALPTITRTRSNDGRDADLEGYKERWHQLVGSYDAGHWRLYHNGKLLEERQAPMLSWTRLDLAAYTRAEPYMQLGDLVRSVVLHDTALTPEQIAAAFAERTRMLDDGRRSDQFHFSAGPYLNTPDSSEMWLVWETDRPASAVLEWGERVPYEHRVELAATGRLHKHRLKGLKPDTPYFYRVSALGENGQRIDSGPLAFRTLPLAGQPLVFAVGGDTEARPFINAHIARGVWEARPHLLLMTGDLTDGGTAEQRWQWTHEYFPGMTALTSRVPMLAAPGNGEGDLVWFNHYHDVPGTSGYYSRRVGDVEFFVLNSNLVEQERREPGFRARQRAWLEASLKQSRARWKIALHHHPTYSSDDDDYGNSYAEPSALGDEEVQRDFLAVYERHGVDVVFYSHLHSYERTWPLANGKIDPGGVVHVQVGGFGGNHERSGPTHAWFDHTVFSGYHYGIVRVLGDTLEMSVYDAEHRLRDSLTLRPRSARR